MKKQSNKLNQFKEYLSNFIVDEEIKESLLFSIDFYHSNGKLYLDDRYLYGVYINTNDLNRATPAKEYFEIKIDGGCLICNYSNSSINKIVNIIQRNIKGGNTKITKKVTEDARCYNNENFVSVTETEKIYNYQKSLVYESTIENNSNYYTYDKEDSDMTYGEKPDTNTFNIVKKWYIHNGSIIKYQLTKDYMFDEQDLQEKYLICIEPDQDTLATGTICHFTELDKDLFKKFMTGYINIETLIENLNNSKTKKLKK